MAKKIVPSRRSYFNGMDYVNRISDRFEARMHHRDKQMHDMKRKKRGGKKG